MKNKILIALLSVLLSFTAKSEIIDGICGDNLTWRLNTETGVLKIYGTGEMYNYHASVTPWKQYHNKVLTVFIENGVTSN